MPPSVMRVSTYCATSWLPLQVTGMPGYFGFGRSLPFVDEVALRSESAETITFDIFGTFILGDGNLHESAVYENKNFWFSQNDFWQCVEVRTVRIESKTSEPRSRAEIRTSPTALLA